MRPAAAARIPLALTFTAIVVLTALTAINLRLSTRDERGQAINTAIIRNGWLRLWLERLGLAAVLAIVVALVGLSLTLVITIMVALGITLEWLGLRGYEAGLLSEIRKAFAIFVAVVGGHVVFDPRLRLVLPELLLRRSDQAEIMLGVLVVIFGSHRIAGASRVARQLHVFFGNVRGGTADLDIGAVRFEHHGQRVLAAPVVIVVIVAPVAHPLVIVLTVSHVLPLFQP